MMQPLRRLLCLFLLASCVAVACSSPSYTPGNPLIVEDPSPETFQECEERIHATSNKPYSDPYRQVLEDCVPEIGVNGVLDIIEAANDFCHGTLFPSRHGISAIFSLALNIDCTLCIFCGTALRAYPLLAVCAREEHVCSKFVRA
eukprot:TRINITY_DN1718_c0_g5_i2.p1 TRINITY_DN1718_c0_g5~~TRINITY_DN1718_c0_g5_i2.p1  ORF type:complete len:145 (+),score=9.67 TRINITY_DN1718_c0_g5_i2:21-455(+)